MNYQPLTYHIALASRKGKKPPKNYKYISKLLDTDIEKAIEKIKKLK